MAAPDDLAKVGRGKDLEPDELAVLQNRIDRVQEEKRKALADPGPSWREWFLFSAAKAYVLLGYLIVDVWIVIGALEVGLPYVAAALVVVAIYLEILLYKYLWRRPAETPRGFRPTWWWTPARYGRWTPEGEALRSGESPEMIEEGPNPKEFL
jgi:hypothetical protein